MTKYFSSIPLQDISTTTLDTMALVLQHHPYHITWTQHCHHGVPTLTNSQLLPWLLRPQSTCEQTLRPQRRLQAPQGFITPTTPL